MEGSTPFTILLISKEANLWADACTGGGLNRLDIVPGQIQSKSSVKGEEIDYFLFEGASFISQKLQALEGDFRRFCFLVLSQK